MKRILLLTAFTLCATAAQAADIYAYGAGGPAPAIKAAAEAFNQSSGNTVHVDFGPTPKWIEAAKQNADIVFSGSSYMMADYVKAMEGRIDETSIRPLYLRPAVIVVRKGNPKKIRGFKDLLKPGVKVAVTNGSGQVGLWEDVAARSGNIADVQALRRNIGVFAGNTGIAKNIWEQDPSFDAWLVYNHWALAFPAVGDIVPLERTYRIYRPMEVALTGKGESSPEAKAFVAFLQSAQGKAAFEKFGWRTRAR